jgi:trehalose/maltose transport system substrate-binding protein
MSRVANALKGHTDAAPAGQISASAATILVVFSLATALIACRQTAREPVTLTYFRPGWRQLDPSWEILSQQFTRETGVRLRELPAPESTLDQLDLSRKLLQEDSSGPDVLGIDLIWSGTLESDLIDLRPYLASEISSLEPQLMPSYTVSGKVVAIPYRAQAGLLEYRTDLLHEYGYHRPPETWDELERMAQRIQAGERAKGKKNFWGYVWQGAATEALTCNALEWQIAAGGGRIIENSGTISVNNPAAIRAWERAKRWIGWISPPSVVAYRELDAINVLDSGGAAFGRVWGGRAITPGGQSRLLHLRSSLTLARTGYTSIPGGPGGRAATLGGAGLAVSRHSAHPQEAIELVRFLIRAGIQSSEQEEVANDPAQPEIHDLPSLYAHKLSEQSSQHKSVMVNRPSDVAGRSYEQVTRAYIVAVHLVLTGQKGAPEAAAELEKQLVKITGFTTGPPQALDQIVR